MINLEAIGHAELGMKSNPRGAEIVRERTAGASGRTFLIHS